MEETRLSVLFNKYFDDQATEAETGELLSFARSGEHDEELQQLITSRWDTFKPKDNPFDEAAKRRMLSAIYQSDKNTLKIVKGGAKWPRIAIAAAIATIIVSFGIWLSNKSDQISYANDIAPGKQGATLTLANGKKISLKNMGNGELAREAGVMISKSANGQLVYTLTDADTETNQFNTLSTAPGETYQVRLPDGSVVWLNAASSLTYATKLTKEGKRKVKLEGEGYFEVAKDQENPFIVESGSHQVEVLGTHFNINSYADEGSIKTTLLEGSVRVNGKVILKPNQQSVATSGSPIQVSPVDVNATVDWKNGDFIFKRESLAHIMREVARWYNVEVSYDPDVDVNQTFSGLVSRSKNISEVLISIESTKKLKFSVEGRHVFVSK
ncbi:FecR family protein [Pedobacter deserti]|uniref:FecR family protein n=1 Tax=Pedobacter deserti TaxID=2817382 RepID=UPI00210E4241|nr:FecR family protein [Pedobacter sp. SYSU D00382]